MSAKKLHQETLAMAAGALLWLAFSYLPGLGERYAAWAVFVSSFLVIRFSYSTMVSFSDESFVSALQKGEDKKDRDLHPPQIGSSLI